MQVAGSGKGLKAEFERRIAALDVKNDEMKKKMQDYKGDGKDNWQSFKANFNQEIDALNKSVKDLTAYNKE